jgi:hypothetical protein
MNRQTLENRLARMARRLEAGKINGPGIPDGTGPWHGGEPGSGSRKGPCVFPDDEQENEKKAKVAQHLQLANRLLRMARRLEAKADIDKEVLGFFKDNPNPDDDALHKWAEGKGYDVHEVETAIYKLATLYVKFAVDGKAAEKGFTEDKADKKELKRGIEVEQEHTTDKDTAKRIALDHEAESPDSPLGYYEALLVMEKLREMLVGMPKDKADEKIRAFKALVEGE